MKKINYSPFEIIVPSISEKVTVLKYEGTEEFNKPYEYKIFIISKENNLSLDSSLLNNIKLKISSSVEDINTYYVNGICRSVRSKGFFLDEYIYEIVLVPRIWRLSLQESSKVLLDVSIVDIIKKYMNLNNFSEKIDYEINLTEEYENLEFVCQYNESDLNFITRWLETYGIYYYIINDENTEKVIFSDNNSYHSDINDNEIIYTNIDFQLQENKNENIFEFNLVHNVVNSSFSHDHFDGTRKKISKNSASTVKYEQDMSRRTYGGNPQVLDSYKKFDILEEERINMNKFIGNGKSSVISMYPGGTFTLSSKLKIVEDKYLIKKVIHKGDQTQFLKDHIIIENAKLYENYFEVIPFSIQFRPRFITPKAIYYGLLNGTIDGISENKPLVDKLGRYKVKIPFDTLKKENGKASIPIRVAQPSASNKKSGMHFKLLKGDEVIIGFREGDIDRPVILGAVNNQSKVSTNDNVDEIKRVDTSISMDDKYLKIVTPQKIEIIGY